MIYYTGRTELMAENAVHTTRPFMSGRSQAVRIPKEYRLEDEEVVINRVGKSIIITPRSALKEMYFEGLGSLTDDFLFEGRPEETRNLEAEF